MNTCPDPTGSGRDVRFDEALRRQHATAVERLSPRVRAQLAQRRNAVLRGERAAPARAGLRYAAVGFAALCALAIGVQFGITPTPINPATSTRIASVPTTTITNTNTNTTMLDEDPEFYAWLASADAQQIAME